jgi:hypothetical protein
MEAIMMLKFFAALACTALANQAIAADSLLGQNEPAGYADRVIVVTPDTTAVNVDRGDVVQFMVAGGKTFSWSFATPANISVIDLRTVAPAGFFDHTVKAYIKRIPIYDGG